MERPAVDAQAEPALLQDLGHQDEQRDRRQREAVHAAPGHQADALEARQAGVHQQVEHRRHRDGEGDGHAQAEQADEHRQHEDELEAGRHAMRSCAQDAGLRQRRAQRARRTAAPCRCPSNICGSHSGVCSGVGATSPERQALSASRASCHVTSADAASAHGVEDDLQPRRARGPMRACTSSTRWNAPCASATDMLRKVSDHQQVAADLVDHLQRAAEHVAHDRLGADEHDHRDQRQRGDAPRRRSSMRRGARRDHLDAGAAALGRVGLRGHRRLSGRAPRGPSSAPRRPPGPWTWPTRPSSRPSASCPARHRPGTPG